MTRRAMAIALTFGRVLVRDSVAGGATEPRPVEDHLSAGIDWLTRAHDIGGGGVSYGYSLRGGWLAPYLETSGYILTTFFRAAEALDRPDLTDRAVRIAHWLVGVQNGDGSFANPKYGNRGLAFDTGQDLFGLVAAHERTAETPFLTAARRAGTWLVEHTDADGIWRRHEYRGIEHTYNTRTAWALLRLHAIDPDERWISAARANLDRALVHQHPSGFFGHNAFLPGKDPYTHNISYAVCGLQESAWLLGDERYEQAARRCSDAVLPLVRGDGFIPGQIAVDGSPAATYSCLTGQCQLAVVWAKQHARTGSPAYREASRSALGYALRHHDVGTSNPDVRGALGGSAPIWGRYASMSYPNWAVKFLVDACLLQLAWEPPTVL